MNRASCRRSSTLGLGDPLCISSAHGDNVHALMELVLESFPADEDDDEPMRRPASPSWPAERGQIHS
jgi:predicted GTPase